MHTSLDEAEFQPDLTSDNGVTCLERLKNQYIML